jgi:hypothetical protein
MQTGVPAVKRKTKRYKPDVSKVPEQFKRQTATEMGVGYATAIRVGKEIVKRHKEYERERKKAKAEGKAPSPDELKKSGYRLADIDKSVILPPQVRKAARIAQAYFEPEGTGFKLLRAEKLAKELIRTLEGLW